MATLRVAPGATGAAGGLGCRTRSTPMPEVGYRDSTAGRRSRTTRQSVTRPALRRKTVGDGHLLSLMETTEMWRTWVLCLTATVSCSSPQPTTEQGSCTSATVPVADGGETKGWSCTSPQADAPRTLLTCPTNVAQGGPCSLGVFIDATEPGECFACANDDVGADLSCVQSHWQTVATLACKP
jgi:hypothetical protein